MEIYKYACACKMATIQEISTAKSNEMLDLSMEVIYKGQGHIAM